MMDTHEKFVEKAKRKLESLRSRRDHLYEDDHGSSDENHHGASKLNMSPQVMTAVTKPATFDGSTSWHDYVVHYEIVCMLNVEG